MSEVEKDTEKPVEKDKKEKEKDGDVVGLDEEEATGSVKLISKDKKEFTVEKKFAQISTLVKTTLEQDKSATEVPIPGVTSAILAKVIDYMEHHKGTEPPIIPKPLRSKEMKMVCSDPWDATYIDKVDDVSRQDLYDLILAANYMDIKSLLHLGCAKVASLIKGQPLEKIKDILSKGTKSEKSGGDSDKDKKEKEKEKEKDTKTK